MKFICISFLCLIIFVHYGTSTVTRRDNTQNIEDLRYPQPLNFTSVFPFNVLRSIFNMTTLQTGQAFERGSNRITSQVSAVVDVLRRVLRYMLRSTLAVSPLRTNKVESTTKKAVLSNSKVALDLPVFTVVNNTQSKNSNSNNIGKEERSNNV